MRSIKRIDSFDILRGVALMLVVFFHTSVYNFANIDKIDFSNPPISVVLISFLILWGGVLIFYSGVINDWMISLRSKEKGTLKYIFISGSILIILHYALNIFLGRWANDFVYNRPDLTVVASSIRNMQFSFPHVSKFFEGSALSTIAFNLIILAGIFYFLLKNNGMEKEKRNYAILWILGFLIMIFSFVRISIYPILTESINNNYLLATFLSFTIANPYPLLPYLAYGCFAAILGLMIYKKRNDLIKKLILPTGVFFFLYGLIGCMNFPKTISTPDYFWYFKTHLELGIFILLMAGVWLIFKDKTILRWEFIKNFSRVTLTVYLLETFVSEIFRKILLLLIPSWNQTINGCLLFGAFNVLFWIVVLSIWKKHDFKYSLEYYWVKLFRKLGKESTKLE